MDKGMIRKILFGVIILVVGMIVMWIKSSQKLIDLVQAKEIVSQALPKEVQKLDYLKQELDDNVYEITVQIDGTEVEFEVDAKSGVILKQEYKKTPGEAQTHSSDKVILSLQQALEVALQDAHLTQAEIHLIGNQLTQEDGQSVYEVEFYAQNQEYDYTIHAQTGAILEKDFDIERFTIPSGLYPLDFNQITGRTGIPKVEIELDRGQKIYEVTYYENGMEYQYDINESGQILNMETEKQD